MLDYKLVNNGSNNSTLYWTFNSSSGFNDRMSLTSGGALTVTSTVVTSDGFQGRYYRIREASANRGGLYPYNLVVGSGTDYSIGIFSEGEIFLASGGSATKRFTMNNSGVANFTGNLTAANLSGTNTGDQTLSGLGGLPLTGGTLTGPLTINTTGDIVADGETFRMKGGGGSGEFIWYRNYSGSPSHPGFVIINRSGTTTFSHNSNGGGTSVSGNFSAANFSGTFSGTSSGTNTGDQTNISGNSATTTLASNSSQLGGYGIDQFRSFSKLNTISMGGNTSTFYPVYFNGDYWYSGVGEIEILRTSVHQDGSSFGTLMSKIRGRSTSWGHHFDFWESEIYISNGIHHPFIANAVGHSTCTNFLVWLKGGLTYFWRSDSPMSVNDASATSKTISCGGTNTYNTQTTVNADFTAGYRWYMTGLAARNGNDLGTSSFRWGTVFGVTGNFSGDVIAYSSSDERLKENIKPIQEPVKKTKSISGVEFDWNETLQSVYKGHDIGVIAQEIERVLPELVTTRDDGYKAVKYEKIVALLIEAIKEQQTSIEKLESRIERLEN
jgi:hypothetical protein